MRIFIIFTQLHITQIHIFKIFNQNDWTRSHHGDSLHCDRNRIVCHNDVDFETISGGCRESQHLHCSSHSSLHDCVWSWNAWTHQSSVVTTLSMQWMNFNWFAWVHLLCQHIVALPPFGSCCEIWTKLPTFVLLQFEHYTVTVHCSCLGLFVCRDRTTWRRRPSKLELFWFVWV